jgi:hypothetical protein
LKGEQGETKGNQQGETKGNQQGERKKQGECAMYIVTCVRVYKRMLETFE